MHWGRLSGKSRWVNGEDVVGDNVVTDEVVTNEYRWTPECQRGRLLVVKKALRERDVIDALRDAFPDAGIGDDAAVLPRMGRAVLFATDAVVEGIHFRREFSTLSQAIQKLITSNVSDIYAMGGIPSSILFTAGLPKGCSRVEVGQIIEGLKEGCDVYGMKLVGGDTVLSAGGFFFNLAILGEVGGRGAVSRSGASEGDSLVLFGECGASLTGYSILAVLGGAEVMDLPLHGLPGKKPLADIQELLARLSLSSGAREIEELCSGLDDAVTWRDVLMLIKHHLVPLARPLDLSLLEAEPPVVSAMIDISDGLARDLATLCRESGVGAIVEEASIPIHDWLRRWVPPEGDSLTNLVLSSGEEYILLASMRGVGRGVEPQGGTVIGKIVSATEGVTLVSRDGERRQIPEGGYEHIF